MRFLLEYLRALLGESAGVNARMRELTAQLTQSTDALERAITRATTGE